MSEVGSMETGKSADKWDALRKAAEAATGGFTQTRWVFDAYAQRVTHWTGTIADCRYRRGHLDGPFIAEANPAVILELLNELATLSVTEGVDGWIDCKQELPPYDDKTLYLVWREGYEVEKNGPDVTTMQGQSMWYTRNAHPFGITHWQKIEPPAAPQSSLDATKGDSE